MTQTLTWPAVIAGLSIEDAQRLKRAVTIAESDEGGVILVASSDRKRWAAYRLDGEHVAKSVQLAFDEGRVIGVYQIHSARMSTTVAAQMIEDVNFCLGRK